MRVKALGIIAAVALAGAASLAGSLSAQEEPDVERRVRVLALGQGSYLGVYISDITGEDVQQVRERLRALDAVSGRREGCGSRAWPRTDPRR